MESPVASKSLSGGRGLRMFCLDHGPLGIVWSATASQAKNESDNSLVCANVYGLRWSAKLLALMDDAAPSS